MVQATSESPTSRFQFEITEDGSPTLRILSKDGLSSEAMHSLRGALSETKYIYGSGLREALSRDFTPRVLSMGLGLGYVEILAIAEFVKHGVTDRAEIESFELLPELRNWFRSWIEGGQDLPLNFSHAYDEITSRTASETGVDADAIRSLLAQLLRENRLRIRDALTEETSFSSPFGCICFDAFSSKSTPELWSEVFLTSFLSRAAAERCVLTTYACTGALKRSLRGSGFNVEIREGFSSKRDSTFAVRDP